VLNIPFNQSETSTNKQLKQLFKHDEIDAVLFATNYLALSGLKVLKQLGKKLDENFGVIGYDDHEAFELHTPSISAIQQPLEEIAETIIKLLLTQLGTKTKLPDQQIIIPAKLILRQ
jgi:LacI family transcriptional regulator